MSIISVPIFILTTKVLLTKLISADISLYNDGETNGFTVICLLSYDLADYEQKEASAISIGLKRGVCSL